MKKFIPLIPFWLLPGALAGGSAAPLPAPQIVHTPASGDAPLSDSVQVGNTLYLSGKLGLDAQGKLPEGVQAQTRQAILNMQASLAKRGFTLNDLVKCTVMLADMDDFAAMNEVYREMMPQPYPARSALGVSGLAVDAAVEIECMAAH